METKEKKAPFLKIQKRFSEIDAGNIGVYIRQNRKKLLPDNVKRKMSKRIPALYSDYGRNMLFFDIETTGLNNNDLIFMIALAYWDKGIRTEVLFARDPSEERAILHYFVDTLQEGKERGHFACFTYNGTAFDLPRITDRAKHNRIIIGNFQTLKDWLGEQHIDLYPVVKRKRRDLPDMKLQTLEKLVFNHTRENDISGKRIPQVYHQYVYGNATNNGKEEEDIMKIISHSIQDVLSLIATLAYLCD